MTVKEEVPDHEVEILDVSFLTFILIFLFPGTFHHRYIFLNYFRRWKGLKKPLTLFFTQEGGKILNLRIIYSLKMQ